MDKQVLIDKAIEDLEGNLPKFSTGLVTTCDCWCGAPAMKGFVEPRKFEHVIGKGAWKVICDAKDFEGRAKELGWVNGYLWGREYPTNGKKPDLPDDCEYHVKFNGMSKFDSICRTNKTWKTIWESVQYFKIVGDRYKPKQPESNSKPSDNSWHERGEFPTAGAECEVKFNGVWYETRVVGMNLDYCVFYSREFKDTLYDAHNEPMNFRPIKSEKEKFIEAAIDSVGGEQAIIGARIVLGKLYDSGCRFVSQESLS